MIDADQFTEAHTYTDAGTYTVVVTIENTLEGSGNYTTTCSTGFVVTPPPGAPDCGSEVEINVDYTSGYDTMTINDVVCSGA